MMVTWLTRSLLLIVVGAVLAYAVTLRNDTIDIQTTGVIILLVGIFDLLLNVALTLYYRQEPADYRRLPLAPTAPGRRGDVRPYPGERAPGGEHREPRPYPDDDTHVTRPIPRERPVSGDRDHPNWH